jgi:hypothetical protein
MRVLATIDDPRVIWQILAHLGSPTGPARPDPRAAASRTTSSASAWPPSPCRPTRTLAGSMRPRLVPALLGLSLVTSGCAARVPNDPFVVPREEFYRRIHTIAVVPVSLPRSLGNADGARARFDELIESSLRKAGFSIVPPREVARIRSRVMDEMGAVPDPETGEVDRATSDSVAQRLRLQLRRGFSADGVLYPSIRLVRAAYGGGWAVWDGAREPISIDGSWGVGSHLARGTVSALSLSVTIEDISGSVIYLGKGGVQVLSKISGVKFVTVPANDVLAREERNRAAVNLALRSLLGAR